MKEIRDAVLNCIYNYSDDDEKLIRELDKIAADGGGLTYSIFFNVLTHIDFSPQKAQAYWRAILDHRRFLMQMVGRSVNLRTAICDYFCAVDKSLENPVFIDIHVFEKKLKSLNYDSLTGLHARSSMDETLSREVARAKRYETELCLLFFDLDDFKRINDMFGHLAGDMVLKDVSRIIKSEIRTEDSAARYGGEEIVVVLPQTGKLDGLLIAERIRKRVAELVLEYESKKIHTTISGGLASFPIDAQKVPELLKFADNAMYQAKILGKNNISVYSQNKRRYLRIDFAENIHVRQVGFNKHAAELTAKSKNLSRSGILFESGDRFSIGTKVQLMIPVTDNTDAIVVLGRVVRVEVLSSGRYDIGVSFLELDQTAKNELANYVFDQLGGPCN
ncbi:MAG: diguanylate cyclase [Desulfobacterales bacterium]